MAWKDDIQKSVEPLLNPASPGIRSADGVRTASISELQRAVSGAFLADPSLLYAVASLARDKLLVQATELETLLSAVISGIRDSARLVPPPTDLGPLRQASLALDDLQAAAQDTNFKPLRSSPAYQRFRLQTRQYLKTHLPALRTDSATEPLAQAPGEGQMSAAKAWSELETKYPAVLEAIGWLSGIRESLQGAALPRAASSRTITESRARVQELVRALEGKTAQERLRSLKTDLTTLLGARASLSVFENLPAVSRFYPLEGAVVVSRDADHPSTRPSAVGVAPPYTLSTLKTLTTRLGIGPERDVPLPVVALPALEGLGAEGLSRLSTFTGHSGPFSISVTQTEFQVWLVLEDGSVRDGSLTLVSGVLRTATQISAELNQAWSDLGITGFVAAPSGAAIQITASGARKFMLGSGGGNRQTGLGPQGGFVITESEGPQLRAVAGPYTFNSTNNVFALFVQGDALVPVTVTFATGTLSAATVASAVSSVLSAFVSDYVALDDAGTLVIQADPGTPRRIKVGGGSANGVLGIAPQDLFATDDNRSVSLYLDGTLHETLALSAGVYTARSLAALLQDQLSSSWSAVATGAYGAQSVSLRYVGSGAHTRSIRVQASGLTTLLGWLPDIDISGDTLTPPKLVEVLNASLVDAVASVTLLPEGTSLVRSAPDPSHLVLYAERGVGSVSSPAPLTLQLTVTATALLVGHKLLLDDGTLWTVTSLLPTGLLASGTTTPTTRTGVAYDGGPARSLTSAHSLQCTGAGISGTFQVLGMVNPLTVQIRQTVLDGGPSSPRLGSAVIGSERLRLEATSDATLFLTGDGATELFGGPVTALTQSPWLRLPQELGVKPGDTVEQYLSGLEPTSVDPIVEASGVWVRTATFRALGTLSSVKIRNQTDQALELLAAGLESISMPKLDALTTEVRSLTQAHRVTYLRMSQLLTKLQPLSSAIQDLKELLTAYDAPRNPRIDALVRALRQRGADRAEQLLETGRLKEFFSVGDQDASLSGALASGLRGFLRTNLGINKNEQQIRSQVVSSSEGIDPDDQFDE